MAEYTAYADYVIFFQDPAEYDFAVASVGGDSTTGGVYFGAPRAAAAAFGIPHPYPSGDMASIPKGIYFIFPHTPGANINHPSASGVILNDSIAEFLVPGQVGNPAGSYPPGPNMRLKWAGAIVKSRAQQPNDPLDPTPIPQRRFIGGFELAPTGEGGTTFGAGVACRDASRTIDGMGMAIRGQNVSNVWNRRVDLFQAGFTTRTSWERFYFRLRTLPGLSTCGIWRCHGSVSSLAGAALAIESGGLLRASVFDAVNTETILGTETIIEDKWYLCDVILKYAENAGDTGRLRVYLNHELIFDFTRAGNSDLDQTQFHFSSDLGRWTTGADNQAEIDLDDWMNADVPNRLGVESLDSLDWLVGSHIRRHYVDSAGQVNWTPAASSEILNQGSSPQQALNSSLVSTTSGALLDAVTDANDEQDSIGLVLGPVAAIVGIESGNPAGTDGQLGYSIAGGAAVMATIPEAASGWNAVAYRPSGLIIPDSIVPFNIRYTKAADANSETIRMMQSIVEYIGIWGEEDDPLVIEVFDRIGFLHNCKYPNTAWAYIGPIPDGPTHIMGGTYVGNGTQTTVNLPNLCHFLWIRALTGGSSGVKWFGASVGGHLGTTERVVPNYPVRVYVDVLGQCKFTVTGTNVEVNASGVTFQFIAVCDPGMRFNICGAFNHPSLNPGPLINPLQDTEFTPEFAFVQGEVINITSTNQGLSCKGPGHIGNTGNNLSGTNLVNWGSLAQGILNSMTDIHFATAAQVNYSLWRTTDANCANILCQILTYTGDGTGARQIDLTPISGRFPLFALVQPHGSIAFFRDPSHTGSNSASVSALTNSTTAITGGGIDFITVGVTLNTLGTIYEVFVICGDSAGWNNGTFFPPSCLPSEEPWPTPDLIPPEIAVMGDGGLSAGAEIPVTLLRDISGIYTLVPDKTHDTFYERQPSIDTIEAEIPDPGASSGYIGG